MSLPPGDILPPINQTVTVCPSNEFPPGSRHVVSVGGRNILVTNYKGSLFAVDNACYHMGMPLQSGDIEDMNGSPCLTCPWHKYIIALDSGAGFYWGLEASPDDPSGRPQKVLKAKGPKQRVHNVFVSNDGFVTLEVDTTSRKDGEWASDEYAMKVRVNKKEHVTCGGGTTNNNNNNNNDDDVMTMRMNHSSASGFIGGGGSSAAPPPGIHSSAGGGNPFLSSGQVFQSMNNNNNMNNGNSTNSKFTTTSSSKFSGLGANSTLRSRALAQARLKQQQQQQQQENQNQYEIDLKHVNSIRESADGSVYTFQFNAVVPAAAHALLIRPGMWVRLRLEIPQQQNEQDQVNSTLKTRIIERQWTVSSTSSSSLFSITVRHLEPSSFSIDGGGASHFLHTMYGGDVKNRNNNINTNNNHKITLVEAGGEFHLGFLRSVVSQVQGRVIWITAGIGITPFIAFMNAVEQQQQQSINNNNSFFSISHLHTEKTLSSLPCVNQLHQFLLNGSTKRARFYFTRQQQQQQNAQNVERLLMNNNVEVSYGRRMDGSDILLSTIEEMLSSTSVTRSNSRKQDFLVMMCGPEVFMDFVQEVLIREGISRERIFKEKFM